LIDCFPEHASYVVGVPDALRFPILQHQANSTTYGGLQSHIFNYDSSTDPPPAGAMRGRWFTAPAGVTGVRLHLVDLVQNATVGATGAVHLKVMDAEQVTTIADKSCTVGASQVDCVSPTVTVTPGQEYFAAIVVNTGGTQSVFNASRFSVEPVVSSSSFWTAGFARLDPDTWLHGIVTLPGTWPNGRYPAATAFSQLRAKTTAGNVWVETWANGGVAGGTANSFFLSVDIGGTGTTTVTPEDNGGVGASGRKTNFNNFAAAGAVSPVTLTVTNSSQSGSPWVNIPEPRGVFVSALYVPAGAYIEAIHPSRPWIAALGDSKLCYYPTTSSLTGGAALLRTRGWNVDWLCSSGRKIADDVTASTVTGAWGIVQQLLVHNPRIVLIESQRNDLASGTTSSTIQGLHKALYDSGAKAAASTKWQFLQITKENDENSGWDAHRANENLNVCASNSSVDSQPRALSCSILGSDGLWTAAEANVIGSFTSRTADGVHPTDVGIERQDELTSGERFPIPTALLARATLWWEADYGVSGGTMGSVTSAGTSPPSVTFSGTNALPFAYRILLEQSTASHFRWSINGGHTWVSNFLPYTAGSTTLLSTSGGTSTGITVHWPSGSYTSDNSWYADGMQGTWADLSGHSNNAGVHNAGLYPQWNFSSSSFNAQPSVTMAAGASVATGSFAHISGLSVAPPYAIGIVAKQSCTSACPYWGRASGGFQLYAASSTTVAWNDGSSQAGTGDFSIDPTQPHCLIVDYHGTAGATTIYVDGRSNPFNEITSAGNFTLTNLDIGADQVNSFISSPEVTSFFVIPGGVSGDEAQNICARSAFKWGTPSRTST
jgi:hypothetical protein